MKEIFFTSDLHFGHQNIIRFCNRPFGSIEEMDEALINNWNSKVSNSDTVYILGDFIFRTNTSPDEYLSRLKGKKHLIVGNHDKNWMKKCDLSKYFLSVHDFWQTSDGKRGLTLCHHPMMSWSHESRNYMVHGHIHNNTQADYWKYIWTKDKMLNAGVDINNFTPVTFDEMLKNNMEFKRKHPYNFTDFYWVEKNVEIVSVSNVYDEPFIMAPFQEDKIGLKGYLHYIKLYESLVLLCPDTKVGFFHTSTVTEFDYSVIDRTYIVRTQNATYRLKEID